MSSNENGKELSRTIFDCLSPNGGTVLAAIIADILAVGLDPVQIGVIAAFITSIGDNLGYIAAQTELNEQLITQRKEKLAGGRDNIRVPPAPR